jgi:hypothetical protein
VRNSIAVGDIDGDGCSDVVLAHSISGAFALYGRNCTR